MLKKLVEMFTSASECVKTDVGEFAKMKVNGMKFDIESYELAGLGTLSAMQAKGFFGLVKMDTLIFTPKFKDAPLLSYDRMNFFGKDILYFELYDTCVTPPNMPQIIDVKGKYSALKDNPPKPNWYDSMRLDGCTYKVGKKKEMSALNALAVDFVTAYIGVLTQIPDCDGAEKTARNLAYVNGLLQNGGPSTDVFKKGIGEEKTATLFRKFIFGTRQCLD